MQNLPLFSSRFLLSTAILLGMAAGPSPAWAGFEWVPPGTTVDQAASPAASSSSQSSSALSSAPVQRAPAGGALDQMPYVTIEGHAPSASAQGTLPAAPQNLTAQAPSSVGAKQAHVLMPPPGASSATLGASAPLKMGGDKPVKGFANDVPLTVALRQLLPSEYGFSMAQDVDASTLVSWRGGASWRSTMQDMLHVAGLEMQEDGQMIRIVHAGGATNKSGAPHLQPQAENNGKPLPLSPASAALGVPLDQQYAEKMGGAPHNVMSQTMAGVPGDMGDGASQAMIDTWTAERGDTLRKTLEAWSRRANVELVWQAEYDFPLQASVVLSGTFEEAVRNLLSGFQEAKPQPFGALHNAAAGGQAVLVIQTRGNNYGG